MKKIKVKLYTAQHCPHCAHMKKILTDLTTRDVINTLQVYDIASEPLPKHLQFIRSVPVTIINDLPFIGKFTVDEIMPWLDNIHNNKFCSEYIADNLNKGHLPHILSLVQHQPELIESVLPLLSNSETPMQVKIGITALFEEFAGQTLLLPLIPELKKLAQHQQLNIATDAVYYLTLINTPELNDFFQAMQNHSHHEIRELAEDALTSLTG